MLATKDSTARAYVESPERLREQRHQVQTKPQSKNRFNRVSMTLCVVIAFSAAWLIASKAAAIYSMNYANVKLQTQIQTLAANNASLTAQVDELERPSRILNIAINQLHMQYANPVRIGGTTSGK